MTPSSSQIDRRRFVLYSSACALAPSALAASSKGEPMSEVAGERLAIGYWPGTDGTCPRSEAESLLESATRCATGSPKVMAPKVMSAEGLKTGDSRLRRAGVKLTVHGLVGDVEELAPAGIRSAALQVHFRCEDAEPSETVKFNSWSVEGGRVPNVSHGLELQVPLGVAGLELSLDLDHTATAGDRLQRIFLGRSYTEFAGQLSLGGEHGQPKLRQGFYLIPLRQGAFRRPNAVSGLLLAAEPCVLLSVKGA